VANAALLVICGDRGRREGFVRALLDTGWENVLSASSLADAAGVMSKAPASCVIVDAELRDIPGLAAVAILQQFCPHAKIIFAAPQNTLELEKQVRALNVFYYYISSGWNTYSSPEELVAAVEEATGAPRPPRARPRPRILVVDDDHDYQATVRSVLEAAGYEVSSAYSEPEGLDVARREQPDVILLDIIMENTTDGFEFCQRARHDPRIKHIPILGVSAIEERFGLRSPPDEERSLFPVDGYLRKPVVAADLLSELKKFLPERRHGHDGPGEHGPETGFSALRAGG